MKTRESGMPEEEMWEGFFDPPRVLQALGLVAETRLAVEFGCGYGTFCLPAAARGLPRPGAGIWIHHCESHH